MRILTVCEGGNNRSGCLAWALKNMGHDALAMSAHAGWQTKVMLCDWAELVIVTEDKLVPAIPAAESKIELWHVGPDRWGSNANAELTAIFSAMIRAHGILPRARNDAELL